MARTARPAGCRRGTRERRVEDKVVDQPRRADARGEDEHSDCVERVDPLEGGGIHELQIFRLDSARAHRLARGSHELPGRALARVGQVGGSLECLEQRPCPCPLIRVEASIAAGHRKPVALALGAAHLYAHRHVEVCDHALDHRHLLGVLLSEVGDVRRDHVEQLRHHRGDATEVGGPARRALEAVGEAEDLDSGTEAVRVDLLDRRGEQDVGACLFGEAGIVGLAARIGLEVGTLVKLRGIDEQGDDDKVALFSRTSDQREVSIMQGAHRGHESERGRHTAHDRSGVGGPGWRRLPHGRECAAQLGDGAHDLHAQSECRRLTSWLIGFGPVPCGYRRD